MKKKVLIGGIYCYCEIRFFWKFLFKWVLIYFYWYIRVCLVKIVIFLWLLKFDRVSYDLVLVL